MPALAVNITEPSVQIIAPSYFDIQALSSTGIKHMLDCPARFKAWWDGKLDEKKSDAFNFGGLLHCLALEPQEFNSRYLVTGNSLATKAGKEDKARAEEYNLTIVKEEDYTKACAMVTRLQATELWQAMDNANAHNELVIQWEEYVDGIWIPCKAKLDRLGLIPGWGSLVCDYKSTRSANPAHFKYDLFRYGYHTQADWYLRGSRAVGHDVEKFVIMAQEKEKPYEILLVEVSDETLFAGRQQCDQALSTFARCMADGYWPGYGNDEIIII